MNSRSSVNETNLVNYSTDLSTLNPLDTKETLLSFPFDHLYACHSETSERRQTLQLDKEIEISTHCIVGQDKDLVSTTAEIARLTKQVSATETQNKRLKDLLIYHLDLIQQQNDLITKRDKLYQALKQENETLKSKLGTDKKTPANLRQTLNPPPLVHVPTTCTVVKSEPCTSSQIMFDSYPALLPDTRINPFLFNSDITKTKPFGQEPFELTTTTDTDVSSYFANDLGITSILDGNISTGSFTMIENKRSFVKKDTKSEARPEPLYTVTTTSGNPVIQKIQRNRRKSSGIGSLSRVRPTPKVIIPETKKKIEDDKNSERTFSVNKKSKMINTYGKSKTSTTTTATIPKRTIHFTGSLSDRLKLIDTTPTGEDPYQLGEADMREQSPIPKLMLQKTNHGRMKICTGAMGESTITSRCIYDMAAPETKTTNKLKVDKYHFPSTVTHASEVKKETITSLVVEPDLDLVKAESDMDWRLYSKAGNETSLCDFSYGENSNNLATSILPNLDSVDFQELFATEPPLNLEGLSGLDYNPPPEKKVVEKTKKRGARTTSLVGGDPTATVKRGTASKRGRKRAQSTTGLKGVKREVPPKGIMVPPKPKIIKGKAACRGKKSPVPGMVTNKPYHTLVGDPDLSWYLGLDPDVKMEDIDPPSDCKMSTVEVPRWREKLYTSCYTLEGTENLDDKVFEKRHHKLEAEERRQLRWHMRRVREQKHVERLRLRQRDSWWNAGASQACSPKVYTIWPQPLRDVQIIEITDTLPVMAFGENLPALPEKAFMLPWVRVSKALKRSKRSKTLH